MSVYNEIFVYIIRDSICQCTMKYLYIRNKGQYMSVYNEIFVYIIRDSTCQCTMKYLYI